MWLQDGSCKLESRGFRLLPALQSSIWQLLFSNTLLTMQTTSSRMYWLSGELLSVLGLHILWQLIYCLIITCWTSLEDGACIQVLTWLQLWCSSGLQYYSHRTCYLCMWTLWDEWKVINPKITSRAVQEEHTFTNSGNDRGTNCWHAFTFER